MKVRSGFVLFLFLGIGLVGCGDGRLAPPPSAKVKGNVTLDAKPMAGGEVRFVLPGQPSSICPIKDGVFAGDAYVGKNKVEVVWEKEGPPNPMDPKLKIPVNVVSDLFNGPATTLTADVTSSGPNAFKFDVKTRR